MADKDYAKLNTPIILTIGIVTTIVAFGLTVPGVKALLSLSQKSYDQKHRVWVESPALQQYEAQEANDLNQAWVDESGKNRIPIDRAHEVIIERAAESN